MSIKLISEEKFKEMVSPNSYTRGASGKLVGRASGTEFYTPPPPGMDTFYELLENMVKEATNPENITVQGKNNFLKKYDDKVEEFKRNYEGRTVEEEAKLEKMFEIYYEKREEIEKKLNNVIKIRVKKIQTGWRNSPLQRQRQRQRQEREERERERTAQAERERESLSKQVQEYVGKSASAADLYEDILNTPSGNPTPDDKIVRLNSILNELKGMAKDERIKDAAGDESAIQFEFF